MKQMLKFAGLSRKEKIAEEVFSNTTGAKAKRLTTGWHVCFLSQLIL
jgi:hypothetical protein